MGFPLKDWIDSHGQARHNLAQSGVGPTLISARRSLARPKPADFAALRRELGGMLGVATTRVFPTHGATEGNSLVLHYLAHRLRQEGIRRPTAQLPVPEYPPLTSVAELAGFHLVRSRSRATVTVVSDPNNPRGRRWSDEQVGEWVSSSASVLLDETFREFTHASSRSCGGDPGLWTTGSFTKAYGGDPIRVGYVIAPPEETEEFDAYHGLLADGLAEASVGSARALLAARDQVLAEARGIFRSNLRYLQEAAPDVELDAPVWFDRERGLDGDRLARALLRRGVLVCPGSFFGDPRGVRVCLTQPSFPQDFAAYRETRRRWDRSRPAGSR